MRLTIPLASVHAIALLSTGVMVAELRPDTRAAFDRYVTLTEARMAVELDGRAPFLWIDRQPDADRRALADRLRRGEVVSERLETRDGAAAVPISGGVPTLASASGTCRIARAACCRSTGHMRRRVPAPRATRGRGAGRGGL